jgi:hypothetical protein
MDLSGAFLGWLLFYTLFFGCACTLGVTTISAAEMEKHSRRRQL